MEFLVRIIKKIDDKGNIEGEIVDEIDIPFPKINHEYIHKRKKYIIHSISMVKEDKIINLK